MGFRKEYNIEEGWELGTYKSLQVKQPLPAVYNTTLQEIYFLTPHYHREIFSYASPVILSPYGALRAEGKYEQFNLLPEKVSNELINQIRAMEITPFTEAATAILTPGIPLASPQTIIFNGQKWRISAAVNHLRENKISYAATATQLEGPGTGRQYYLIPRIFKDAVSGRTFLGLDEEEAGNLPAPLRNGLVNTFLEIAGLIAPTSDTPALKERLFPVIPLTTVEAEQELIAETEASLSASPLTVEARPPKLAPKYYYLVTDGDARPAVQWQIEASFGSNTAEPADNEIVAVARNLATREIFSFRPSQINTENAKETITELICSQTAPTATDMEMPEFRERVPVNIRQAMADVYKGVISSAKVHMSPLLEEDLLILTESEMLAAATEAMSADEPMAKIRERWRLKEGGPEHYDDLIIGKWLPGTDNGQDR